MRMAASRSSYASSGFAWIARESAKSASRRSSIALIARCESAFGSLMRRGALPPGPGVSFRLMSLYQCQDHTIERAVRFFEKERGLLRCEPAASRDVRDLRHEPRAEEEEGLRALAERKPVAACLVSVLASERLGLRDELIATDRARGVEMSEKKVAHADAALAEPAERILIEARVPVLRGEVDADALAKLRGDAVGSFAESAQRLAARLPRAGKHGVDRGAHEPPVSAGRGEDLDLPGVGPPPERVGVNAEDAARLPQRQPITALDRRRGLGDTANLGEARIARERRPGEGSRALLGSQGECPNRDDCEDREQTNRQSHHH